MSDTEPSAPVPRPRFDAATGRKILGYDPYTGEPILEPEWRVWWRGFGGWGQTVLVVAGGAGVVVLFVLLFTGKRPRSDPHLDGTVHGHMVGAGNIEGSESLSWSNVYCGWRDGHVLVHADLTNDLGTASDPIQFVSNRETVSISPIYTIRWSDGSEHRYGDGFISIRHVRVPAQQTVSWYGNAGHPEGIKKGAPISSCVPEVMDVTTG